jgi:adenosylhomocysteinase
MNHRVNSLADVSTGAAKIGWAATEMPITVDDGADLITALHSRRSDLLADVTGGLEETTTGVVRLRAMARDGALRYPVIAVNDAMSKHLFDNRYGTGQSTLDGRQGITRR